MYSRSYGWIGLGVVAGILASANGAFAQGSIHKNGFDAKVAWSKGGFDAAHQELAHRIDNREPHGGLGAEYIEIDAKQGKYVHYFYPVGKAPISPDLRTALWVRSNRPGVQLMARIVLPNELDDKNLGYRLTTYIKGDAYQQAGRWQLLEIARPVTLAKQQQHLLTAAAKRNFDFTGAYIDALVLDVYAGPGATQVWIDDLEIGPLTQPVPIPNPARPDNNSILPSPPGAERSGVRGNQPIGKGSVVEFAGNRIVVGNQRVFFRAIRYTDTIMPVLKKAGFNVVVFDKDASPTMINEAINWGMWIAPEFRVMKDDGTPLSTDDIAKQVHRWSDSDAVLFRRVAGDLSFEQAAIVARAIQSARAADQGRPVAANVLDGMAPYSRSVQLVGTHRWPLMTTLELPKYREWMESRKNLANQNTFTWTWIQTHLPDWYAELLYNQSAKGEFREPVGPQPEQIRLLTYTALAAGCRGLGFSSDRFLADSHQGRDRLLCCALLNQELDMAESLLVTADDLPQWIETSVPEVKAAVFRCKQGVLVMPIWQGKFSQFVPGQAAVSKLSLTVPQVPKTVQAWEISPGEVRSLKLDRQDKGTKVLLPEFGLTSMILFTADMNVVGKLQDEARARRELASQYAHDMALYELEKVNLIQQQLEQLGATLPGANSLIEDSKRRLEKAKALWDVRNFGEAYHEANRALRPVRILMRGHWEKAVRGLDTPAASPYAVSFYTLPKHWQLMDQVKKAGVGPNMMRGGDFEIARERLQDAWKADRKSLDEVDLIAERVTELKGVKRDKSDQQEIPVEGRQCAMLQIKLRAGRPTPTSLERSHVALVSPEVKLPPGTLVQVSGMVCVPEAITASVDGVLMYDSAGGEPLAIRLTAPAGWKKYTVYRRVPASGTIQVTLSLTGVGTVYFDDIRVEPLIPPGGVAVGNRSTQ